MAPAVDEDESVNWADFTTFGGDTRSNQQAKPEADNDYDLFMPVTADTKRKRRSDTHDKDTEREIEQLSERLEDLKE
ncbi:hypothetical protein FB645_005846 [Coemansia sp. IMI 203386]|nr:hypothetical protein FB645_005846 [Coemansia sp. IMI 203386]